MSRPTDTSFLGRLVVRKTACSTCIYKKDSPLDIEALEAQVKEARPGSDFFAGYRICHHHNQACCLGFWKRHKDQFAAGQIAQRRGLVVFSDEDSERHEEPVS